MVRKLSGYYWGVRDCDKCKEGEEVYFCIHCGRFYCAHCLILDNGSLVCPSGRDHKLIEVAQFGLGLGKKMVSKLQNIGKNLESMLEILDAFSEIGEKIGETIKNKIYIDKDLFDETLNRLRDIENSINRLGESIKEAYHSIKNDIALAFKKFGEGDIKGAISHVENPNIGNLITLTDSKELRSFLESLDKEVTKAINMFETIRKIGLNVIWDDEWLVSSTLLNNGKKSFCVIITDKRVIAVKNKSLVGEVKLEEIVNIEHKGALRFKGLVIKHQGGQMKIPCESYECFKIRINIDKAQSISNLDMLNEEDLLQLTTTLNNLKSMALNLYESFKALETEAIETTKRSLKRFLTRFYYSNGGSNFIRGILDLVKNQAKDINKISEVVEETSLPNTTVTDYPHNNSRKSKQILNMVLSKLRNLKGEVEAKLNMGQLDSEIVHIYFELRRIIDYIEREVEEDSS